MKTQIDITNPILITDGYKPSHAKVYNKDINYMQSYFESRSNNNTPILFFGLQYILKQFINVRFTEEHVKQAEDFFKTYYGRDDVFDADKWYKMAKKYGYFPVNIYAVPEGTVHSGRTPLIVVESTDEEFFWVVNYLETILSQVWYPTTVATYSYTIKNVIRNYMKVTSTLPDETLEQILPFKLHDFGMRGVSSFDTSGIGGMSFLVNFMGTDTLSAILFAQQYYNARGEVLGFSIPATEHSTMTSQPEKQAIQQYLQAYPNGIIACVSDSYDIENAIRNYYGKDFKDIIESRDGTLVVRPDSGDPVVSTQKVFEALWDSFGGTINEKGFKVLNPKVSMIQGDGIDLPMIEKILDNFVLNKICTTNITFGSGGGLLQKHNRDTYKFAFKCNLVRKNDGSEVDVKKSPMEWNSNGDYIKSFKHSKSGNLIDTNSMELVYSNGQISKEYTFQQVKDNASIN